MKFKFLSAFLNRIFWLVFEAMAKHGAVFSCKQSRRSLAILVSCFARLASAVQLLKCRAKVTKPSKGRVMTIV
ncbi:hypothetical protein MMA231_03610 (plasmid) [Asticcacaulis sp. MM231]